MKHKYLKHFGITIAVLATLSLGYFAGNAHLLSNTASAKVKHKLVTHIVNHSLFNHEDLNYPRVEIDPKTGVEYLVTKSTNILGTNGSEVITPRLDKNGKPLISQKWQKAYDKMPKGLTHKQQKSYINKALKTKTVKKEKVDNNKHKNQLIHW